MRSCFVLAHRAPSQEETPRYLQYQLADRTPPKFMEESHHDSHTEAWKAAKQSRQLPPNKSYKLSLQTYGKNGKYKTDLVLGKQRTSHG